MFPAVRRTHNHWNWIIPPATVKRLFVHINEGVFDGRGLGVCVWSFSAGGQTDVVGCSVRSSVLLMYRGAFLVWRREEKKKSRHSCFKIKSNCIITFCRSFHVQHQCIYRNEKAFICIMSWMNIYYNETCPVKEFIIFQSAPFVMVKIWKRPQ